MQKKFRLAAVFLVALVFVLALHFFLTVNNDTTQNPKDSITPTDASTAQVPGQLFTRAEKPREYSLRLTPVQVERDDTSSTGVIRGQVLSSATDQGVAEATLTFANKSSTYTTTSGALGLFEFTPPSPGLYLLVEAIADGFFPFAPAWGKSPISLNARAGYRIEGVRVFLTPAIEYQGLVTDLRDRPISGAAVNIQHQRSLEIVPGEAPVDSQTRSDPAGRFLFRAQDFDVVTVSHPAYAPASALVDQAAQVTRSIKLQMSEKKDAPDTLAAIFGTVVAPDNSPVPDASIYAHLTYSAPFTNRPVGSQATKSDASGKFSLTGLLGGHYSVTARAPNEATATVRAVPTGTADLVLRVGLNTGRLEGTITAGDGVTLVGAYTIVVYDAAEATVVQQNSFLDATGHFTISSLPPGSFSVRAFAFGFAPSPAQAVRIKQGETSQANFDLSRGGCLLGTVVESGKSALAEAKVSIDGGFGLDDSLFPTQTSTVTGRDGTFRICGVKEGLISANISAFAHHGKIVSALKIQPDADTGPITVELEPIVKNQAPKTEFVGVGAVLTKSDGLLTVTEVVDGGGAAFVGLGPGDIIEAIDGKSTANMDFDQAVQLIRGQIDSVVVLKVKKADGEFVELNVPRRKLKY